MRYSKEKALELEEYIKTLNESEYKAFEDELADTFRKCIVDEMLKELVEIPLTKVNHPLT